MTTEVRWVHCEMDQKVADYVGRKVERLGFARDLIVELPISIKKGKKDGFDLEATVHFRWGKSTRVGAQGYDLHTVVDALFDKLEQKITRVKAKLQHHKGEATVRTGGTPEPEDSD